MGQDSLEAELKKRVPILSIISAQFMLTPVVLAWVAWEFILERRFIVGAAKPQSLIVVLAICAVSLLLLAPTIARKITPLSASRESGETAAAYFRQRLILFAVLEAVTILGFVITIIAQEMMWCVIIGIISLAGMVKEWPSIEKARAECVHKAP